MTATTIRLQNGVGDTRIDWCGILRFKLDGVQYEISSTYEILGEKTFDLTEDCTLTDVELETDSICSVVSDLPDIVSPGDTVVITLSKTHDWSTFYLHDADNQQIAMAGVIIDVHDQRITTNARGAAQIKLPLGMHDVSVTLPEGWEWVSDPLIKIGAGYRERIHITPSSTAVCVDGETRDPTECWDETTVYAEECREGAWWGTGDECPERWIQASVFVQDEDGVPLGGVQVDAPNARTPYAVPDTKVVSWNTDWAESKFQIPGGKECPITISKEGYITKTQIAYGVRIAAEGTDFVMEKMPEVPECTTGDVKPGHACIDGYWEEAEPPEPAECIAGDVKPGHVCEDGFWEETEPPEPQGPTIGTTIEFQEMIPGITPPRVPLLVAGFESIPLLPGWIVRDADGNIVNEGMKLLTLKDILGGV